MLLGTSWGSSGAGGGQLSTIFLKFNWKNFGADYSNFTIICKIVDIFSFSVSFLSFISFYLFTFLFQVSDLRHFI